MFLNQNNSAISYENQLYLSETIRKEIIQEATVRNWKLDQFDVPILAKLAKRQQCDLDLYAPNGQLLVSSFATAENSPAPKTLPQEVLTRLRENISLISVERQYAHTSEEPYLRTYFGIFRGNSLAGIGSISSFESDIGTSPYIPIVMEKLLNVYVFLLLIAWGGGLLLIGLLTKPLELLANRLSNFQLGSQNKKLNWKGEDAIGQLITEYNKMVDKMEVTTQELIRSEREGAWQVMAQQIAHEINNKLTPLRLNVQFLTRMVDSLNPDESEPVQRITKNLVEKIDGLSKVATQFNLFAQLDSPEVKPIEIKTFFECFLVDYPQKDHLHYSLEVDLTKEQIPRIDIDIRHLKEVLTQIISNAENTIPPNHQNGQISIRIQQEVEHVKITIQDNGKGIDAEVMENIFDPKFSVTSSQTGLGLPICKRIIEFYRGQLTFTTEKGVGTSFYIHFPLTQQSR